MASAQAARAVSAALAIFVKTPGRSPLKTRLAASIGAAAAERFHQLACAAVEAVARAAMPEVIPAWAVAEAEALADRSWQGFPTLWQGPGSLGERLHRVCTMLQSRHGHVLLIGADSPQLQPDHLRHAARTLVESPRPFVLGRAEDGGFWLFGSRLAITGSTWMTPCYSSASTADELVAALHPLGGITSMPSLADVDCVDDLAILRHAMDALPDPLLAQRVLREWLHQWHLPENATVDHSR